MFFSKQKVIKKDIPDNEKNGLVDCIKMQRNLSIQAVELDVNIEHPYSGDVGIELHGPGGKSVSVFEPNRKPGKNVKQLFSGAKFDVFKGMKSKGDWKIKVVDSGARDNGKLVDWTLKFKLANAKKSEVFITDEDSLTSVQYCHHGENVQTISADVHVEHGHVGDLVLDLTSPGGKTVTLQSKMGGANKQIKTTYKDELKSLIGEASQGKWTLKINDTMPRDSGRLVSWALNLKTGKPAAPSRPDDLTKIEGIGPKIAEILNNGGIKTFEGLATSDAGDIKNLLDAAGPRFKMHNPGSWPRQSRMAADGNWEALEKLQDELDGGR